MIIIVCDFTSNHYALLGPLYYFRLLFRCPEKPCNHCPRGEWGTAISTSTLWVINCLS